MGLAASQGTLLLLTARGNDLGYEFQQLSRARLTLSDKQHEAAEKYNEAMNNTTLQATVNSQTQPLTYDVLTSQDPFSGLCMRLVDTEGNVVIPGESIEVQETITNEETGVTSNRMKRYTSSADFINSYMKNLSDEQKAELSSYSLADIFSYYNEHYSNNEENANITVIHRNKSTNNLVKDGEKTLTDNNIYDTEYLQQMILSGEFKIQQSRPDGTFEDIVWQSSTLMTEVMDTSDDAAAKAEYDATLQDLNKKDKTYELKIDEIKTEQNAVQTEVDSIKNIIKENVEKSFTTFKS